MQNTAQISRGGVFAYYLSFTHYSPLLMGGRTRTSIASPATGA